MASPTATHAGAPAQQAHTPGVGSTASSPGIAGGALQSMRPSMTGVAQTPDTKSADPVLFTDLDPVYLARLYPHAKSSEEAQSLAMAAGKAAQEDGGKLIAAQQEGASPETPAA